MRAAFVEPARHRLPIEGDRIDAPPIGTDHMPASHRSARPQVRRAGDDAIVSVAHPTRLPPWSMPQPDFTLLRPLASGEIRYAPA